MQIICNKAFHFQQHEILENTKTGENVAVVKQEFRCYPAFGPQLVPDWIEHEELFRLAVEDESIQVVQVLTKSESKAQTIVQHTDQMGWGAKPGNPNKGSGLKVATA